jgi:filamentous hemagglutinin family protein
MQFLWRRLALPNPYNKEVVQVINLRSLAGELLKHKTVRKYMNFSKTMKVVTWNLWFNPVAIAFLSAAINAIGLLSVPAAIAQIIPDRTLGTEQSILNQNVTIHNQIGDRIEGGARRGGNLFHSFEAFNVNEGQRLYFADPAGVVNIIGRVTGNTSSHILGTLGVEGTANLFLLNPNGIVFGEHATLDVRGSFVATTANRLQFGTQGFFSTDNPQAPPLLTINPSALVLNHRLTRSTGGIQTQSVADAGSSLTGNPISGLRVADAQNLLLVGGNLAIAGGLNALGGQLGLAAVNAPATVELSGDSRPAIRRLSPAAARGDVLIHDGANLNVQADGGGEIQIYARNINIQEGSTLSAGIDTDLGNPESQAGSIVLDAADTIDISEGSFIANVLGGMGQSGDIVMRGRSLTLDQATLGIVTLAQGNAGRISIQIAGPVILTQDAAIVNEIDPIGGGATGGIFLKADSLTLMKGGILLGETSGLGSLGDIVVQVRGHARLAGVTESGPSGIFNVVRSGAVGNAGAIRLSAGSLAITQGAVLEDNTSAQGNAGDVRIRVRGRFLIDGKSDGLDLRPNGIFTTVNSNGVGNGGNIDIQAGSLTLSNGGQLAAGTGGHGNAGDITVQVRDRLLFEGVSNDGNPSGIFSSVNTNGIGNAGNITVQARSLTLLNGAQLINSTFAQGNAGNTTIQVSDRLFINGNLINVTDPVSGIFTFVNGSDAVGNGGDITVQAGSLTLLNGAQLRSATLGHGNAGDITVRVHDQAIFDGINKALDTSGALSIVSGSSATAPAVGNGGDINISANQIELRDGAALAASVETNGQGNAGSITLIANDHVLIDGRRVNGSPAGGIFTRVRQGAVGNANDIRITTDRLTVSHEAGIQASIESDGKAGNIDVTARVLDLLSGGELLTTTGSRSRAGDINLQVGDRMRVSGQDSGLFASTATGATGRGGDIQITTPQLNVSDHGEITVSSPTGRAGNLTIAASQINLDQGNLTAKAGVGGGAQITLQNLNSLLLSNNSLISAQAFARATGGNITVNAPDGFVVAVPRQNSDIVASAIRGEGGNISITAQGIFALAQQASLPQNQTNDLDASSRFSQAGTVTINQADIDLTRGLVALSSNLVDRANQIARACGTRGRETNHFVVTGRGGLPLSPDQPLRDRTIIAPDWVTLDSETEDLPASALRSQDHNSLEQVSAAETPIVEADGFGRNNNGEVMLVAQSQLNDGIHELIRDRCPR